jgi:hypothetical protein
VQKKHRPYAIHWHSCGTTNRSCHLIVKSLKFYRMKLKAILAAAALAAFVSCGEPYRATETTVVVAPGTTTSAFVTQYPTASNVVWTRYDATVVPIDWELTGWPMLTNEDYLVRFTLDNNNYYAWYDANGNWIGTSYAIVDYSTMPSAVSTTISTKYPGYTITGVQREMQKDRVAYEVELKNSDTKMKVLIDSYGNVIKAKSKM